MLDTFHPTVASWFRDTLGAPSPPQQQGWPAIAAGQHVLIAARMIRSEVETGD